MVLRFGNACGLFRRYHGRRLAGYGVYHCLFEDAEVLDIAVGAKFRRMGIGRKLLQLMAEATKLRGAERIMLEVRMSNEGAKVLYLSEGYEITGTRRNYYKNPTEDAILMEKRL